VDGCPSAGPPLLSDHGQLQHPPRRRRHCFLRLLRPQTFPHGPKVSLFPFNRIGRKFVHVLGEASQSWLAAVLHLLVAACAVTVLQLVDSANHSSALHPPSPSHNLHYGYSVLLAWAAVLVSISVSLTFCCASKRRKLLRNDNVTFRNQRLVISEYEKS